MDHEDDRSPGSRDGRDEHPEHDAAPGWVGWLLVVATALPVLVLAESARQVFTGARDDWLNGYPSDGSQLTPDISAPFWSRFGFWVEQVPAAPSLLASTLGVVAVTGVVLLARPVWLVPPRPARWAAGAAAALVALGSLATAAGVLEVVSRTSEEMDELTSSYTLDSGLVELGPNIATLAFTAVAAALCGIVLLRPPPAVPAAVPPRSAQDEEAEVEPTAVEPAAPERVPVPQRELVAGPGDQLAAPEIPRLASSDIDLYRRPDPGRHPV